MVNFESSLEMHAIPNNAELSHLRQIAENAKVEEKTKFTNTRWFRILKACLNSIILFSYVIIGGIVFCEIERTADIKVKQNKQNAVISAVNSFSEVYPEVDQQKLLELLALFGKHCVLTRDLCGLDNNFYAYEENYLNIFFTRNYSNTAMHAFQIDIPLNNSLSFQPPQSAWTYRTGMYLAVTIITTIGYGNIVPATQAGRLFFIVYALFGIPMFFWNVAAYRDVFSHFSKFIRKCSAFFFTLQTKSPLIHSLILRTGYYLIFIALFILLPTCLYIFVFHWPFTDSLYFITVTLTTVGFGDIIPENLFNDESPEGWLIFVLYFFILVMGLSFVFHMIESIGHAEGELQRVVTKRIKKSIARHMSPSDDDSDGLDYEDNPQVLDSEIIYPDKLRHSQDELPQIYVNNYIAGSTIPTFSGEKLPGARCSLIPPQMSHSSQNLTLTENTSPSKTLPKECDGNFLTIKPSQRDLSEESIHSTEEFGKCFCSDNKKIRETSFSIATSQGAIPSHQLEKDGATGRHSVDSGIVNNSPRSSCRSSNLPARLRQHTTSQLSSPLATDFLSTCKPQPNPSI